MCGCCIERACWQQEFEHLSPNACVVTYTKLYYVGFDSNETRECVVLSLKCV